MKLFDQIKNWFALRRLNPEPQQQVLDVPQVSFGGGLTVAGLPRRPGTPRPIDKSKVDPNWRAPRGLPAAVFLRFIEPACLERLWQSVYRYNDQEHTYRLTSYDRNRMIAENDYSAPHDHSDWCMALRWEPYPCGCHFIKNSGGTSPRCDEAKRLEKACKDYYWANRPTAHDPEEQEAIYAEYERLRCEQYMHTCVCGAFDRPPAPPDPAFYSPSGLRTDEPLAVLRSHPDFPGTLSEKYEGRWIGTNGAWSGLSVTWFLDRWVGNCHVDWADSSADNYEVRDGLKGVIVYVRPGPKPEHSKELVSSES